MAKRKKSKRQPQSEPPADVAASSPSDTPSAVDGEAAAQDGEACSAPGAEGEPPRQDAEACPAPGLTDEAPAAAAGDEHLPAAEAEAPSPEEQVWPTQADGEASLDDASPAVDPGEFAGVWQDGSPADETISIEPGEGAASAPEEELAAPPDESRLEAIVESLLFASDKPLGLGELKRLLGERDGKKVAAALAALTERRKGSGIEVAALSSGWHLRTSPDNATWVSKLLVGRPVRLSRAMLETLAIVAYRQPVTRPEVDNIRGVDCGPVLKTLLDRGLVRVIGKKEEVGRPMLYGTTPEFLRVFNLRDLSELPTLREFYDLSAENQSRVEAEHGPATEEQTASATTPRPDVALASVARGELAPEEEGTDPLLDELDQASRQAGHMLRELEPSGEESTEGGEAAPEARADAGGSASDGNESTEESPEKGEAAGPGAPAGE